jgi:hypothetical protein
MNKKYIIQIEEADDDSEDLLIPLSDEILQELDWKSGDIIEWIDNKDGSWTLKRK